jgi:FkbM family methyltransferase
MVLFLNSLQDLPMNHRVCLYGLGEGCLLFLNKLTETRPDIKVIRLMDDTKSTWSVSIPVIKPEEASVESFDLVLITSAYWVGMSRKLHDLGIRDFMVVNASLLYDYLIYSDEEFAACQEAFRKVSSLLENAEQKRLLQLIVLSRTRDPQHQKHLCKYVEDRRLTMGQEYLEYINTDVLATIIEGGVFDGANTLAFARLLPAGGIIYGFEPNLDSLESLLRKDLMDHPGVRLFSQALWSHRTALTFFSNADNRQGARVVSQLSALTETKSLEAVSIDEFVAEEKIEKVDFIKLDVEGAEIQVLHGMEQTLHKHRPQLAICIYHKKEHLYEIPLHLASLLEDYRYELGHYSPTFWDTVWYAIPREL